MKPRDATLTTPEETGSIPYDNGDDVPRRITFGGIVTAIQSVISSAIGAITPASIGAATSAQGSLADSAAQPSDISAAIAALADGNVGDVLTQTGVGTVGMQAKRIKQLPHINLTDFVWHNQGASTITQSGNGTLLIAEKASVSGRVSIRGLEKVFLSNTAYTIHCGLLAGAGNAGICGLFFHGIASQNVHCVCIRSAASVSVSGEPYSLGGVDQATSVTAYGYLPGNKDVFLQVRVYPSAEEGFIDLQICVSHDGYNYAPIAVINFDPSWYDRVGFFVSSTSNVVNTSATFWGYEEAPCTGPL